LENDDDGEEGGKEKSEREKEERTLDELRFVPGDYLCVAVLLPKNVNVVTGERDIAIKGSAGGASGPPATNGWRTGAAGRSERRWRMGWVCRTDFCWCPYWSRWRALARRLGYSAAHLARTRTRAWWRWRFCREGSGLR